MLHNGENEGVLSGFSFLWHSVDFHLFWLEVSGFEGRDGLRQLLSSLMVFS
jgi:hypothetical protein